MFYNEKLGICLIEVITVLIILALCASLMVPYFQHVWARHELSQVTSHLYQLIQQAKNEAQLRHTAVVLCCTEDGQHCHKDCWHHHALLFADLNQNHQLDYHEPVLRHSLFNLSYGQLSWHGALHSPYIVFKANLGRPIGYNGSFYYQSHILPIQQRIILSKTGHLRVEIINVEHTDVTQIKS